MKYKNYYRILGLDSSKASDEEIKSAYRKLAKLYHPDLNVGDELIADKFKEINEAYQVLGNQASRKKYDMMHFAYRFKDSFKKQTFKDKINTDSGAKEFVNTFFGFRNGDDKDSAARYQNQANRPIRGENQESEIDISLEEAFYGGERKIAYKNFNGKLKTIVVNIPRGLKTGEIIRLAGQGKEGKNGGKPGDLLIRINILPHERFKIEESDLITELPITPWEAALGDEIDVIGLDFNIKLTIPSGTTSGDVFRIPNGGYLSNEGNRGDLLIITKIMIPKRISEDEKELFLKYRSISSYNPRR